MTAAAAPEIHGSTVADSSMKRVGLAKRWVKVCIRDDLS
jgi:hypothetical protein